MASPDLAYQGAGDVDPATANLTGQGLQRSLLLAAYLKQQVLGGSNVTRIYTLQPMSHVQTANNYPDMAAIEYIQQFVLLNQISLTGYGGRRLSGTATRSMHRTRLQGPCQPGWPRLCTPVPIARALVSATPTAITILW